MTTDQLLVRAARVLGLVLGAALAAAAIVIGQGRWHPPSWFTVLLAVLLAGDFLLVGFGKITGPFVDRLQSDDTPTRRGNH